ncbi:helix-turn-helix domain-containing protein [Spirosoma utsteinense]|uniref:Transposase n=1 Tax=Spirosoma utsteinense TaxID=2585773 RepID=A0ABR6WGE3_9BACT|nr:winged helix-turn-helix domain-containing protein [Spirosoma utsteinense]MBC3789177.1 transposase [Spirosoma utsteinense]MBC3795100.1 transposase [Spirosoma utsteinense]
MANYKQADYEALRRRCVELKQTGWKQADIARAFGLTPAWVSQTLKTFRQQGESGLTTGKRTGAPPRLMMEQLDQLTTELTKGAGHHGFSGQVWTRLRINQVIDKLFGVSYDPSQIGRLLKKVGWSRQKPARQARQQDPQAVANWQEERLPALKKSQR